MERLECIKDVVKTPSYLKLLACEEDQILLIYITPVNYSEIAKHSPRVCNVVSTSNYTAAEKSSSSGNPLEIDLKDDEKKVLGSVSLKVERAPLWSKTEEIPFPFTLTVATKLLKMYSLCRDKDNSMNYEAVYCICDGKNSQNIVVLGGMHTREHIMRTIVSVRNCWNGHIEDDQIENLKKEHVKLISKTNENLPPISCEITCVFEVYGFPLAEYKSSLIYPYNGSVNIKVVSRGTPSTIITEESITKVKIQSIFGHGDSKLKRFWQKLVILQGCVDALKQMRDPKFTGEHDTLQFTSIHKPDDEIVCQLIDILNSAVRPKLKIRPGKCEDIASVVDNFQTIFEGDMYYKIFEVLKYCKNAGDLANCFHMAMEEVVLNRGTIRIPNRNYSRLGAVFHRITSGELKSVPRVLPADAVEFLLEIGLHQLLDDYSNILVHLQYLTEEDISKLRDLIRMIQTRYCKEKEQNCHCQQEKGLYGPTPGQARIRTASVRQPCPCCRKFPYYPGNLGVSKPLENYRAKMCILGRLHVVLDMSHLAETNCDFPDSMFPLLVRQLFINYVHSENKITSFETLVAKPLQSFSTTFPTWNASKLKLMKPTMWRLCMSSMSSLKGKETVDTVFHYSVSPIFPPNIYKDYKLPDEATDGEFYYVTKMVHRFYPLAE